MTEPRGFTEQQRHGVSRKEFLRSATAVGLTFGGASLLSACGGGSSSAGSTTSDATAATKAPRHGGTLKVGLISGGNAESLNPALADANGPNITRCFLLYDTLVRLAPDSTLAPGLATEWTPSNGFKTWTFKIRPGVKFHDGRALTGKDILYSLKYMSKPSSGASSLLTNVDINGVTAPDNQTLVIPLHAAQSLFPVALTDPGCAIIPAGFTKFTHPVGTGPFMYESFVAGQQSVFVRNPHYWDDGKPYADKLTLTSITDDTARVNALLSGSINVLGQLPYTQGKVLATNPAVTLLKISSNTPYLFYMRVDKAPFDDVRVRTAMKLIIDRPAMISVAVDGYGEVANDLVGKGLTYYDAALPQRAQDLAQAKSLLKAAGHSGLSVALAASTLAPGISEAATLFAQQASGAGVKVKIQSVPPAAFFDSSLQYLKYPFASSYWNVSSLPQWYGQALGAKAPYNETHYRDAEFTKLLAQANAAPSPAQAAELWGQIQKTQYDDGGYAVWANADNLDAVASNVKGLSPSRAYTLGAPTGLTNAWLSS